MKTTIRPPDSNQSQVPSFLNSLTALLLCCAVSLSGCGLVTVTTSSNGKTSTWGGGGSKSGTKANGSGQAETAPVSESAPGQQPAPASNAQQEQANKAPPATRPLEMPTVKQVQAAYSEPHQREAALEIIRGYLGFVAEGQEGAQRKATYARQQEFAVAVGEVALRRSTGTLHPQAQALYEDAGFHLGVVQKFVSGAAAQEYRQSSSYRWMEQQAQQQAAQQARTQFLAGIEATKKSGVDYSIFGLTLGTVVQLPQCSANSDEALLSAAMGGSRGVKETCQGDMGGDMALAMLQMANSMTGVTSAQSQVQNVSLRLADNACPDWVRVSGRCILFAAALNGVMLGGTVQVMPSAESKIEPLLIKKYGMRPKLGAATSCVNNSTGIEVAHAQERIWTPPGLTVTYAPLAGNCQQGTLKVEMNYLEDLRARENAAQEASEPKM